MKVKEIQELIDYIKSTGLEEVSIETAEIKIKVKRNVKSAMTSSSAAYPSSIQTAAIASNLESKKDDESNYLSIKSPMIGTFYRSSNPDSDALINIGDKITQGKAVCIIEAMKLFNEIESEISGTIVKILVENAQPVEFDQPLFLVDPS
ncbi:MAG: acetyl-CoA carboxylase biotin carboxyl carrier protein [Bacteroidetes bacterium]|nr:acetyl-CoA carboxylase biotin carboxyl carrier protein [Bacteroidota bacterium]MDA1120643.1 acetyl-CoA carboxylase biotin carboxyl carrier protein [Bacteroidota bacterium]